MLLTPEQKNEIYALRLALSIAGIVDVKARLKHLRKMKSTGVLTFFQNEQITIAEAVAAVRGVQ